MVAALAILQQLRLLLLVLIVIVVGVVVVATLTVVIVDVSSIIHVVGVLIHVEHHNSPYELVLIRLDDSREWSRLDVRPPVTSVIDESGSCLIGDLRETHEIHTDAVHTQDGVRQVFLLASPVHHP